MSLLALEFSQIKAEADLYFGYLEKIDRDEARLEQAGAGGVVSEPFGRDFKTILKANAIILLYHMVEGTVQRAVDGILEEVTRDNVGYSEASQELRTMWGSLRVRQMRKATEDTWVEHLDSMINTCLQREALAFSGREIVRSHAGNIDATAILKLATGFGFELRPRPEARGGSDLAEIKHSRNLLAHGVQRFTEVGSRMTVAELQQMKDRVVCYLEDLIACADQYVSSKGFRIPSVLASTPAP